MKKILLLSICFLLHLATNATVHTVSNDYLHPAQYTTLQAAHDVAVNDDTIQWYGNADVGQLTLSKRLTICGINSGPTITVAPVIILDTGSNNSQLISGNYVILTYISGISINASNCILGYLYGELNGIFTNCILSDLNYLGWNTGVNCVFNNCLFYDNLSISQAQPGTNYFLIGNTNTSLLFNHCNFFSPISINSSNTLNELIFSNCIFSAFDASSCFPANTAFDHCMFIDFSFDNAQYCGPLVGSNSIMNVSDPFVNGNLSNWETADFQLNESSLGNDAASDGSDIGMHGGSDAWPLSYHYGLVAPGVPVVNTLTLENYVIGISDQIQINSEGSIPSNQ